MWAMAHPSVLRDSGALRIATPRRPAGDRLVLGVDRHQLAVLGADVDPAVGDDRLRAHRRRDRVARELLAALLVEPQHLAVERGEQDAAAGGERRRAEEAALLLEVARQLVGPQRLA